MVKELIHFNEKIYSKCKKELSTKIAKDIVKKYIKECKAKGYNENFLTCYYSPTFAALKQLLINLKNKKVLEVGYRMPMFVDYLTNKGVKAEGIDIEPYFTNEYSKKISIEKPTQKFLKNKYDAIIARITLSRLYDELYQLKTGKLRFKNKKKILKNLYRLLKSKGYLILQDDRGTIFTESQFAKIGFKKVIKEMPILFKDKKGNNLSWNVLVAYQKL